MRIDWFARTKSVGYCNRRAVSQCSHVEMLVIHLSTVARLEALRLTPAYKLELQEPVTFETLTKPSKLSVSRATHASAAYHASHVMPSYSCFVLACER